MTFKNYILQLRRRLQDLRTVGGVVISDLTADGVRWTTSELIEVCNDVFDQIVLLLMSHPQSQIYSQLGEGFFIYKTSGTTDSTGLYIMPSTSLAVITLESTTYPYTRISPVEYSRYVNGEVLPTFDDHFFTVIQDVTNKVRKIMIIPQAVVTFTMSSIYSKTDYVVGDAAQEIHLRGINWLLKDVAERECRDREHNWERSKILDERIKFNLGI